MENRDDPQPVTDDEAATVDEAVALQAVGGGPHSRYSTDKNVEKQGVWFSVLADSDGAEICAFRIARAGGANTKHSQALNRLTKPHRRQIARDMMPVGKMQSLQRQAFSDACVLGWRGAISIKDGETPEGKPIWVEVGERFTKANCAALFEQLPDLADELLAFANSPAAYKTDIRECETEN